MPLIRHQVIFWNSLWTFELHPITIASQIQDCKYVNQSLCGTSSIRQSKYLLIKLLESENLEQWNEKSREQRKSKAMLICLQTFHLCFECSIWESSSFNLHEISSVDANPEHQLKYAIKMGLICMTDQVIVILVCFLLQININPVSLIRTVAQYFTMAMQMVALHQTYIIWLALFFLGGNLWRR